MEKMVVDSIVIAAGQSSRMQADKALLPVGERCSIDLILEKLLLFSAKVFVVLGDNLAAVSSYLQERYSSEQVQAVHNPCHLQGGMLSSVQAGFAKVRPGHAALLNLVDQPFVRPDSYQAILQAFQQQTKFVIPVGRKNQRPKKGHPILFNPDFVPTVVSSSGCETFRDLLLPYYEQAGYVQVEDPGVVENLNTKELFQAARLRYERANS